MGTAAPKPNLDVCSACGKLYARVYVRLCPGCVVSEENRFLLVKDFLRENRGASISEIAESTGLSRGEVARYYSEGRLVDVDPGMGQQTECTCDLDGRRCDFCRRQLASRFDQLRETMASGDGAPGAAGSPGAQWAGNGNGSWRRGDDEPQDGRVRYVRRVRRTGE